MGLTTFYIILPTFSLNIKNIMRNNVKGRGGTKLYDFVVNSLWFDVARLNIILIHPDSRIHIH